MNLTIAHYIYLNRDQRYALHDGHEFDVIGVSLPVWVINDKVINEPTKEIFCKYYLSNPKKDKAIGTNEDGYSIALPFRPEKKVKPLTNEEWRRLNMHHPEVLEQWYKKQVSEVSSKNLLDHKDGGCQKLFYREHNLIKKDNTMLKIMHFINIEDISVLEESMVMLDSPLEEAQYA